MGILNKKSKFAQAPAPVRVETFTVAKPRPSPTVVVASQSPRPSGSNGGAGGGSSRSNNNGGLHPDRAGSAAVAASASRRSSSSVRASPNPSRASPSLNNSHTGRGKSSSPYPSSADERRLADRKRKLGGSSGHARFASSRSPASERPDFGADSSDTEDDDWEDGGAARNKRRKRSEHNINRKLRHPADPAKPVTFVHGADEASLKPQHKCTPAWPYMSPEDVPVELQYPGSRQRERYELVYGKDKIDAVKDILDAASKTVAFYLTDEEAAPFRDQNTGVLRQLEKAKNIRYAPDFKAALNDYNTRILALQKSGAIARNLDATHDVPEDLAEFILQQTYDRAVAPEVERLKKYENGTDFVYGELKAAFASRIFELTQMTSDMVFVDLGSGVGNVVIHAALEIGCESWGCEAMGDACDIAQRQLKEFKARCQLWGIGPGKVRLLSANFCETERIPEVLRRADVVLVNNQVFGADTNNKLVEMFLDLKSGCKIVSLKSFVHDNKNSSNDVAANILEVEHLTYPSGFVSWTDAGGHFCISTRK